MKKIITLCVALALAATAGAQELALKTNLLYWAARTPNIGVEAGIGKRLTLDVSGNYNPIEFSGDKFWKHWLVQPELRWWFCDKFNGSFLGVHALGGEFNVSKAKFPFGLFEDVKNHRYEGYGIGGGITYGYQWILGNHWNLEAAVGVGYIYLDYDKYECGNCGEKLGSDTKNYFGPTKAALSLMYFF